MTISDANRSDIVLMGEAVAPGRALGDAFLIDQKALNAVNPVKQVYIQSNKQPKPNSYNVSEQRSRLSNAYDKLAARFDNLKSKARLQNNNEQVDIIDFYYTVLTDHDLQNEAADLIDNQSIAAEAAISQVYLNQIERFEQYEDEKVRAWALDLYDILNSLLMFLTCDSDPIIANIPNGAIVIADVLTPSQLIGLPTENIVGIVCERGDSESHAAILAAGLQIPAVFACHGIIAACRTAGPNLKILLDADIGHVVIDPGEVELCTSSYVKNELDHLPAQTADGTRLELLANIVNTREYDRLKKIYYDGTGLLRTEALFAGSSLLPDEEVQYLRYCQAIKLAGQTDGPIIIRTFDLAAANNNNNSDNDLTIVPERNCSPYKRGLSRSLKNTDSMRTQLRAIMRAYVGRDCHLLFPLVMTTDDFSHASNLAYEIYREMQIENSRPTTLHIGAMIETPQAVEQAEDIYNLADFISIGSNDLASYTEGGLFTENNLNMIRMLTSHPDTVSGRKRVVFCGEMAASTEALTCWLELGLRSFSIASYRMHEFKKAAAAISIN